MFLYYNKNNSSTYGLKKGKIYLFSDNNVDPNNTYCTDGNKGDMPSFSKFNNFHFNDDMNFGFNKFFDLLGIRRLTPEKRVIESCSFGNSYLRQSLKIGLDFNGLKKITNSYKIRSAKVNTVGKTSVGSFLNEGRVSVFEEPTSYIDAIIKQLKIPMGVPIIHSFNKIINLKVVSGLKGSLPLDALVIFKCKINKLPDIKSIPTSYILGMDIKLTGNELIDLIGAGSEIFVSDIIVYEKTYKLISKYELNRSRLKIRDNSPIDALIYIELFMTLFNYCFTTEETEMVSAFIRSRALSFGLMDGGNDFFYAYDFIGYTCYLSDSEKLKKLIVKSGFVPTIIPYLIMKNKTK